MAVIPPYLRACQKGVPPKKGVPYFLKAPNTGFRIRQLDGCKQLDQVVIKLLIVVIEVGQVVFQLDHNLIKLSYSKACIGKYMGNYAQKMGNRVGS